MIYKEHDHWYLTCDEYGWRGWFRPPYDVCAFPDCAAHQEDPLHG